MLRCSPKHLGYALKLVSQPLKAEEYSDLAVSISATDTGGLRLRRASETVAVEALVPQPEGESGAGWQQSELPFLKPHIASLVETPLPKTETEALPFSETDTAVLDSVLLTKIVSASDSEIISLQARGDTFLLDTGENVYTLAPPPAGNLSDPGQMTSGAPCPACVPSAARAVMKMSGDQKEGWDKMMLSAGFTGTTLMSCSDGHAVAVCEVVGESLLSREERIFLPAEIGKTLAAAGEDDEVRWEKTPTGLLRCQIYYTDTGAQITFLTEKDTAPDGGFPDVGTLTGAAWDDLVVLDGKTAMGAIPEMAAFARYAPKGSDDVAPRGEPSVTFRVSGDSEEAAMFASGWYVDKAASDLKMPEMVTKTDLEKHGFLSDPAFINIAANYLGMAASESDGSPFRVSASSSCGAWLTISGADRYQIFSPQL